MVDCSYTIGWAAPSDDGDVVSASAAQCDVRQSKFVHRNKVFHMQKKTTKAMAAATL